MEPEQASSRSSSSNSSSAHQQQTTATTGAVAEQQPGSVKKKSKLSSFLSSSKNKEKAVEPSKGDGKAQLQGGLELKVLCLIPRLNSCVLARYQCWNHEH